MPYTKQALQNLHALAFEDVDATLIACGLSTEQDEYADEEIQSKFDVIRKYFTEAQVTDYAAAAELFKQQPSVTQPLEAESQTKTKKKALGKKMKDVGENGVEQSNLNVLELIALASEQCKVEIELTEALEIMPICGLLPNQRQFTPTECERFLEACNLIKTKHKSYEEVAAHFGVTSVADEHSALVEQINSFLNQASNTQSEQIRAMLPKLAAEQLQEIKAMFWQMTAQRLRQHVESGELEAEIKKASSHVLASSGNSFRLLNQSQTSSRSLKSLPGSSTNASISE